MSGDDMPGKRKTPINWKEYNKELVNRGEKLANNLQTIRTDVVEFWDQELEDMNEGKMGKKFQYPNSQIIFFSVLKSAFNSLSYRNLEGFGHMFFDDVPNYTRINRRIKQLDINVIKKINKKSCALKIPIPKPPYSVSQGEEGSNTNSPGYHDSFFTVLLQMKTITQWSHQIN